MRVNKHLYNESTKNKDNFVCDSSNGVSALQACH